MVMQIDCKTLLKLGNMCLLCQHSSYVCAEVSPEGLYMKQGTWLSALFHVKHQESNALKIFKEALLKS